jgi:transposase
MIVSKQSSQGAPSRLNYTAMIYALVARIVERIPTIKDLVKRLKYDFIFRLDCGFLVSDPVPSEASFSRLITKLQDHDVLQSVNLAVLNRAFQEGFIEDDTLAIDATHVEARDQAPPSEKKPTTEPKKRGRKSKAEREQWLKEQQEREASLSLYEKSIEAQLDASLHDLLEQIPLTPQWGIKKNSEGKNVFWYGYKAHVAVGTTSQYIFQSLLSSGNLNDGKAAIPLLKGMKEKLPFVAIRYITMDAGYDVEPIYQQVLRMRAHAIIAYNKRRESEIEGFDSNFAPTCVREHSYRYDSYDPKYQTIKYVRPTECKHCPLQHDSLCQKVFKVKITNDLRKYSAPGRGTETWKKIYQERTAVERVIAYLKEYFQLDNIRFRTGKRAKVHVDLVTLVYNSAKLAVDRLNRQIQNIAA